MSFVKQHMPILILKHGFLILLCRDVCNSAQQHTTREQIWLLNLSRTQQGKVFHSKEMKEAYNQKVS
jgi:hypothetical protein